MPLGSWGLKVRREGGRRLLVVEEGRAEGLKMLF